MKKLLLFIAVISKQVVTMEIRAMAMKSWETASLLILHWITTEMLLVWKTTPKFSPSIIGCICFGNFIIQ